MGSSDIVKCVVACSGILKPIIAKCECTSPITTPNKATSSFSYTVNMSQHSTTYASDHLYRKTTFYFMLFKRSSNVCTSNTATLHIISKCLLVEKCAANETTMCQGTCNLLFYSQIAP